MAFWDNPQMVINHIRHSCVTSDDTGMCEMVIVNDESDIIQMKQRKKLGILHPDESNDYGDYSQSFDIAVSPGVIGRTPKTNRTDRRQRSNQENQCKKIHWDNHKEQMSEKDRDALFLEKKLPDIDAIEDKLQNLVTHTSALSKLLEDSHTVTNQFIEYAKFDGEGLEDTCPTKCTDIFLTFLPSQEERLRPRFITFLDTASVQDVIGLALYKYLAEDRNHRIQNDVKPYNLHIAEEDGEADMDFQALDPKELMSKFDFQYLALVEKHKRNTGKGEVEVKIYIPHNGYSVVKFDRTDVKIKAVLAKLIKKRGLKIKLGRDYQLEKQGDEGNFVDMEATLESTGVPFVFNLVRESGTKRNEEKDVRSDDKDLHINTSSTQAEIMSLQYKSYSVTMTQRLLASTEVLLGIHGQKIEIDPVAAAKSKKYFTKMKPVSLDVDAIVDCELTEEKNGRATFRMWYKKSDDFKHYDFESSPERAREIVDKISIILKYKQTARTEFLTGKEKKRTLEKSKHK